MSRFSSASLVLAALLSSCSAAPEVGDRLVVGAAAVEITPPVETFEDLNGNGRWDPGEPFKDLNGDGKWTPTWMAGFGVNRFALGVHDPLWARVLYLRKGNHSVALVACDVVGLLHGRILALTGRDRDGEPMVHHGHSDDVIICSTHSHSGPDTVGLWGPLPMISGVAPSTLSRLKAGIDEALRKAKAGAVPATLHAAEARVEGIVKDVRPPDIRNELASSLVARDESGRAIAVLVNFAMHPEGMGSKNRMISSDYPHYLREAVERDFPGSVAIFVSGDLGGMQTPDIKEHTWEEIRRCGEAIAARVKESQQNAPAVDVPTVKVRRAAVRFPLENKKFLAGYSSGLFGQDSEGLVRKEGEGVVLESEVVGVRLGSVEWVTIPGEAFPEVGQKVYALMEAPHRFLLGLGQDEIGYILPKEDFDPKKYEESMSLGPSTAPTLLDALDSLLKGF
jgi:hypothetical protein